MYIYTIHGPNGEKLEEVKAEMVKLGAPVIHVVDCTDYYMALEGSHRVAAAHQLGIKPELIIHESNDIINITSFDWYEPANWSDTHYRAGEVAGSLQSMQSQSYDFDHIDCD